jgi:membrane protease YdiL (CAAX protease family)
MDESVEQDFNAAEGLELVVELVVPPSRPWLTVVLTLLVGIVYVVVQAVVGVVFLVQAKSQDRNLDIAKWVEQTQASGTLIAVCLVAATLVSAPLTLAFGRLAHRGAAAEVLGLRRTSAGSILRWTLATIAFVALTDGLTWLSGREIVPPFMRDAYLSARWPALLWFAVVVAAPVSEELLFRGLLFGGLVNTRLGFVGTALITSACFAALHVQYDSWAIAIIFVGGLLLAAARHSTGSIVPCLAMHAAMNFIATCEAAFLARPA